MERLRSTPQERWAANTPQRKLLEDIFAGTGYEEDFAAEHNITEAAELAELDDLLKAVTGFYHMVQVMQRINHADREQIDSLLTALTDPIPRARGALVGTAALRRASGFDAEQISDHMLQMAALIRRNCIDAPQDDAVSTAAAVTRCIQTEIAEMAETLKYRQTDPIHAVAGEMAVLYSSPGTNTAHTVRAVQQHFALDGRAPLHMVDSPVLRAALYGIGRHHHEWAARQDGLELPHAQLMDVVTGYGGRRPESLRETLACMNAEEIAEIEADMMAYWRRFITEYGAGEDLPDDDGLEWPMLPGMMRRLLDGADGLGEYVRSAAGNAQSTRDVIVQLREWYARAPLYYSEAGDRLFEAALNGEPVDEAEMAEVIDRIVELFTTPVAEVNAEMQTAAAPADNPPEPDAGSDVARRVEQFLDRLQAVGSDWEGTVEEDVDVRAEPEPEAEVVTVVAHADPNPELTIEVFEDTSGDVLAVAAAPVVREEKPSVAAKMRQIAAAPTGAASMAPSRPTPTPVLRAARPPVEPRPRAITVSAEQLPVSDLPPRQRPEAQLRAEGKFGSLTAAQIVEALAVLSDARDEDIDGIIAHFTSNGTNGSDVAVARIRTELRKHLTAYRSNLNETETGSRAFMVMYGVLHGMMGTATEPHIRPLTNVIEHHSQIPGAQRASAQRGAHKMMYWVLESALSRVSPTRRDEILGRIGVKLPAGV